MRRANGPVPQGTLVIRDGSDQVVQAVLGSLAFSTDGLGLTPGNPLSLIQASETDDEAHLLSPWFEQQWARSAPRTPTSHRLRDAHSALSAQGSPHATYALILQALFAADDDELDEDRIVKSATGIRNTVVWKKLYKFQRDGVVGAIDKLERFGGCIIADSVGLGKTFEALAIIKYHELRNDRVLVLVPKAPARQLDALQGQRPPQHPGARPLQLRRAEPHRPVARRRDCPATSTSRTSTGATTTSSSSTSRTTSATRRRRAAAARRATTA